MARSLNLADLFEVVAEEVPDRLALASGDTPAHVRRARPAGQPAGPPPRSRRRRQGRQGRDLRLEPGRVGGGAARRATRCAPRRSTSTTATSPRSCATCSPTATPRPSSSSAASCRRSPRSATELPLLQAGRRARRRHPGGNDGVARRGATTRRRSPPQSDAAARHRARRRRPLHALHRRHDRHAEGRDVAPRGPVQGGADGAGVHGSAGHRSRAAARPRSCPRTAGRSR